MLETEVLSLISKKEFNKKVKAFTEKFGDPIYQRRAAISLSDYQTQIDTRIKITNTKAHIVQKTGGEFSHYLKRQEINIDFNFTVDELISLIRMIQNIGVNLKATKWTYI